MNDDRRYERYQRQILLKEFGEQGQQKLMAAKVLVIGAGGLGCPALQYLTAAGVGTIGIVDDDVVSLSNHHRQVLYNTKDIGLSKAEKAASALRALNTEIAIIPYNLRLTNYNALDIIAGYDYIIDGTDNFGSRYMINDACVLMNKPLVYGAISKFEGQVAVFNCNDGGDTTPINYRDIFPDPPSEFEVANCSEAGVLGVLPGIIGAMQANETIKLITGIGKPLINRMLTYNALNNQTYELELFSSDGSNQLIPKDRIAFESHSYDFSCSANVTEIDNKQFNELIRKDVTIIDVREAGEEPVITEFKHLHIPLDELNEDSFRTESDTVVTFCASGKRSLKAAGLLFDAFKGAKKIYSLKGGITQWKKPEHK